MPKKHTEPETVELKPNYPQVMRYMANALATNSVQATSHRAFVGSFVEVVRYVTHTEPTAVQDLIDELAKT